VNSISIDWADDATGNTVYVGTAFGGIWKTTNALSAAPTYAPLTDALATLAIGSIALDGSVRPAIIYAASGTADRPTSAILHGNGIYKSVDAGGTWSLAAAADQGAHSFQQIGFSRVLVDPVDPRVVLAGAETQLATLSDTPQPSPGVYRSTDKGVTWSLVLPPSQPRSSCTDMIYDPVSGAYFAAMSGQGIFRSQDRGATWALVSSPFATAAVDRNNWLDASLETRDGIIWAFIVDSTSRPSTPTPCKAGMTRCDTGMVQSGDGGATWTPVLPPPVCTGAVQLCQMDKKVLGAPPGSSALTFGNVLLWQTPALHGLSTTWTALPPSYYAGDYHSIAFFDSQRWLLGSDLGLSFTPDATATPLIDISTNLATTLSLSASQMGNGAYLTSSQDNVLAESVGGTTWKSLPAGIQEGYSESSLTSPNQYFAAEGFRNILYRSDDNGATEVAVVDATVDASLTPPFQQLPADTTQIVLGTCRVWKGPAVPTATNQGWTPISPDLTSGNNGTGPCKTYPVAITAVAGAATSADVIYAVTLDGHVQKTTNGSSATPTWTDMGRSPLPTTPRDPFHALAVSPVDSNTAYIGVGGLGAGHVFMTSDGGASWVNITGNLPDLTAFSILIDPIATKDVYVGTAAGVFNVMDGGLSGSGEIWTLYGQGLPNALVSSLEFSQVGPRQIIAGTYGRGVWVITPLAVPSVAASVTSLSFGSAAVGSTSASAQINLTNSGTFPLTVNGIDISGDFSQTTTCNHSIVDGAACTISVIFTPTAIGTRTGTVTVTDNATDSPQLIALTGIGTAAGVTLAPDSVTFPGQLMGTPSAAQSVTLKNTGTASLNVSAVTISGDFSETDSCKAGGGIAVGATCTVNVVFQPTATGTRTGTVTVTDNAVGSPHSVALAGTGTDIVIAPRAGSSATVTVDPGQSATVPFAITPVNGFSGLITLSCSGSPQGVTCTPTPNVFTMDGGATANANIVVTTTSRSMLPVLPGRLWEPPYSPLLAAGLGALLALVCLFYIVFRVRPRWLLVCSVMCLTLLSGCGGGGGVTPPPPPVNPNGTPTGTYVLTITATASNSATRTATLTLKVN